MFLCFFVLFRGVTYFELFLVVVFFFFQGLCLLWRPFFGWLVGLFEERPANCSLYCSFSGGSCPLGTLFLLGWSIGWFVWFVDWPEVCSSKCSEYCSSFQGLYPMAACFFRWLVVFVSGTFCE